MLTINPLLPIPYIILLFGLSFIYIFRSYLKIEKKVQHKRTLASLRFFTLLVLMIIALRPKMEYTEERTQKDRLYLLYDRSLSMSIKDMPARKSRSIYLQNLIDENKSGLNLLKKKYDLKEYSFANELEKNVLSVNSDNSSAIGSALYKTALDSRIRKVKGVILFSDGINNSGTSVNRAVSELKRRNIPVYSVMLGRSRLQENYVDGRIKELDCPTSIKRGKDLEVFLKGSIQNLKNQTASLELLIDDKLIKTIELSPDSTEFNFQENIKVNLEKAPLGYRKLSVKLQTGNREISPPNNEQSSYFQIKDAAIKVLILATSPSPDFKFLNRVIKKMDDIAATVPNPFLCRTEAGKRELADIKPQEFDVIMLLNPDLSLLPVELIQKCETLMKARKQGLFLTGDLLFRSLFKNKLLSEYLPIESSSSFSLESKEQNLNYTDLAENHFITQFLEKNKNKSLAPITGRSTSLKASLSAKTLIEQDKSPILVLDQFQQCRVAWLNTDGLWQWMTDPSYSTNYLQLWKRMIYHLAHRENDLSTNLAIYSDKARYKTGDKVTLTADFISKEGATIKNASIHITSENEKQEELKAIFNYSNNSYKNESIYNKGGLYTIAANTTHNDSELKSNEIKIFVEEPRIEFDRVLPDEDLMNKLAKVTGGEKIDPTELPALLEKLESGSKVRSVRTVSAQKDVWDNLFIYLAAALLLSLEWFKRRRLGLA